jgi:2-methylcitrate dehydratase PrpD
MNEKPIAITKTLSEFIADTDQSIIPETVYEHAKVAFLDWLGVTLAGKDDPLVAKLLHYADTMGGRQQATILGHKMKKSMSQAALINGAASHALDYDDSLVSFLGHPTVTLLPGLLALSEFRGESGIDLLTAYIIGLKAGTVIASSAGGDHYMSGYHTTSTMGCLASASACGRLLGLDSRQTAQALGLAGTQSGGLKRVFGTMCKPFHAGRASEVGLMSALLAEDGFTSAEDILEGPSGLFQAMKGAPNELLLLSLGKTWAIEDLAQKYHASCHATHSSIEAAWAIFDKEPISVDDVKTVTVYGSEFGLSAAFNTNAHTGLEGKFSIPYCVANALIRGRGNTGLQAFTDEKVNDSKVQALMAKIMTKKDPEMIALDARVEIEHNNGDVFSAYSNILNEIPPLDEKRTKIRDKFLDLAGPVLGKEKAVSLSETIYHLDQIQDVRELMDFI